MIGHWGKNRHKEKTENVMKKEKIRLINWIFEHYHVRISSFWFCCINVLKAFAVLKLSTRGHILWYAAMGKEGFLGYFDRETDSFKTIFALTKNNHNRFTTTIVWREETLCERWKKWPWGNPPTSVTILSYWWKF